MRRRRGGFAGVLALCLMLAPLAAQEPPAVPEQAELDAALGRIRAEHGVTALAACALRGGQLVGLAAVGTRRRDRDTPVGVEDRWHLGSCTKAMTATLCAMLVDDGHLRFESTLPELFPGLAERMHADWHEVTLLDLLRHRSGLCAAPLVDGLWRRMTEHEGPHAAMRAEIAEELLTRPAERARGEFLYSNAGYIVVGAALERLCQTSWEELMAKRLFEPLGMTSAGFGAPGREGTLDAPQGHRGPRALPVGLGRGADNPPALGPAGTVHASLRDWAKFIALHVGCDEHEPPLVKPATLARLHEAPAGGEYACGFGVGRRSWASGAILSHSGSNTMWYCVVWASPQDRFAVLVAANEAGTSAQRATDAAASAWIERFSPHRKRED